MHDALRILILNWRDPLHPSAGGAETYLAELARRWVARGNTVDWLTAGFRGSRRFEQVDGVNIRRVGNALTLYPLVPLAFARHYRDRVDVIVDSSNGVPQFAPLFTATPTVLLMHHVHHRVFQSELRPPLSWALDWIESRLVPMVYADAAIAAVSDDTVGEMRRRKMSRREVAVVPPAAGDGLMPGGSRFAAPTVLYLGRLKHYKRVDMLIGAMRGVRRHVAGARLIIAGAGDDAPRLQRAAAAAGHDGAVEFLGRVDDLTRLRLLRGAWTYATASLIEGFGITALEANACGTPVVCLDVPGLREFVRDGVNGLTVQNPRDLEAALIRVLTDASLRARLSSGALDRAAEFRWDASADAMLAVIDAARRAMPAPVASITGKAAPTRAPLA